MHFSVRLILSLKQVMGRLVLMCKCISFLLSLFFFVFGTIANIYFAEKNWALLTDLLNVKKKIFYIIVFIVKRMAGK